MAEEKKEFTTSPSRPSKSNIGVDVDDLNLHYPFMSYPFELKPFDGDIKNIPLFIENSKKLFNYISYLASPSTSSPSTASPSTASPSKTTKPHLAVPPKNSLFVINVGSFQDDMIVSDPPTSAQREKYGSSLEYYNKTDTLLPKFISQGFLINEEGKRLGSGIDHLEVITISPSIHLKDGIPYYLSHKKNSFVYIDEEVIEGFAGEEGMTYGEDEYSKYLNIKYDKEGEEHFTITFRWFFTPFINRNIDDDIKVDGMYLQSKFKSQLVRPSPVPASVISKSSKPSERTSNIKFKTKIAKEYAFFQYGTEDDVKFSRAFTDVFSRFYSSYSFKPIIINNAVFINQPVDYSNYFISNINTALRAKGYGNNIIYYFRDNYYYIHKVVRYWLINDNQTDYNVEAYRQACGFKRFDEVSLNKDNLIDLKKLCVLSFPPERIRRGGGKMRIKKTTNRNKK
jgi:hypothetical protein